MPQKWQDVAAKLREKLSKQLADGQGQADPYSAFKGKPELQERMRRHDAIAKRSLAAKSQGFSWVNNGGFDRENVWEGSFADILKSGDWSGIDSRINTFGDADLSRAEQALSMWETERKQVDETAAAEKKAEDVKQSSAAQAAALRLRVMQSQYNPQGRGLPSFGMSNQLLGSGGIFSRALIGR